jgi:hypothetical protein
VKTFEVPPGPRGTARVGETSKVWRHRSSIETWLPPTEGKPDQEIPRARLALGVLHSFHSAGSQT